MYSGLFGLEDFHKISKEFNYYVLFTSYVVWNEE